MQLPATEIRFSLLSLSSYKLYLFSYSFQELKGKRERQEQTLGLF